MRSTDPSIPVSRVRRVRVGLVAAVFLTLAGVAWAGPGRPELPAGATPAATEMFPDLQQDEAGYWRVDFKHLASFPFGRHKLPPMDAPVTFGRPRVGLLVPDDSGEVEMPTRPGESGTIPAQVRALDGKPVRISGYMLPVRIEGGRVKECLLLRSQMMCCYGRRPELNEWVIVRLQGDGVPSMMDTPVSFYGTLHVGEKFENQIFEGLYELEGEKMSNP
jgi:hypothetical protein